MTTIDPYKALGVSASKEDVHAAILELEPSVFPGAFCQVVADDEHTLSIIHADGAGTKSTVAYIKY